MKPGLVAGDVSEITVVVDEQSGASLLGGPVHPLYGTAGMIAHMEWAARQHILPYLEADEEGVGYQVQVTHLAPAPLGAVIRIRSVVTEILPRRITSQVEAWHGATKVGEGTLTQAIVSKEKLYACLSPASTECALAADLEDVSGKDRFSFRLLRWESETPGCTRYDEWLVCQLEWQGPQEEHVQHTGAFLLRYEIEEWQQACLALSSGEKADYASDFLEPVFSVQMRAAGEHIHVQMTLSIPQHPVKTLRMVVTPESLRRFSEAVGRQFESFVSLL